MDTGWSQVGHRLVTGSVLPAATIRSVLTNESLDRPAPSAGVLGDPSMVEIRTDELQVFVAGRRVGFTVREFQIFSVLADRPDRVVRRAEIYEHVWGAPFVHRDRSVDVFIRKVRRKLHVVSPDWDYVHTHFGIGYRFAPERRAVGDPPPDLGA